MWTASVPTRPSFGTSVASSERRAARAVARSTTEDHLLGDVGSNDLRAAFDQTLHRGLPQRDELGVGVARRDHHLAGFDAALVGDEAQQLGETHIVPVGAGDERLVPI